MIKFFLITSTVYFSVLINASSISFDIFNNALKKDYSFEELCKNPELAAQTALGPINDFDFDVSILFLEIRNFLIARKYDNSKKFKIKKGLPRVNSLFSWFTFFSQLC